MLKADRIVKSFRGRRVLDGIDFSVSAGEIVGFLGPNGAGKTTTVRVITGILKPDSGRVEIGGLALDENPVECKRMTSLVPEQPYLWERLSGREYLSFIGGIYGVPKDVCGERSRELLEDFGLAGDAASAMIENYSYGMRQKLAWCGALLSSPRLLVLDEPFTGLDPASVRAARARVESAAAGGAAVFISTHILEIAEKLCGKICVLSRGRIVAAETRDNLKKLFSRDMSLEEIYFELVKESQPGF